MYIPKQYQIHDYEMIKSFMNEHNFVTIVTYNGTTPIATHLPVNIEEKHNELYISGHFAKGNEQWKTIDQNQQVLIIFQGSHGYISSTWYDTEDVPTWDYQSVHAYGTGQLLTTEELESELIKMLDKYENHRPNGASWNNLSKEAKQQIKGIVGFKVKINKLEAAFKMSQNRTQSEKENIIIHLNQSDQLNDKDLACELKKL